jgi:hypothetical protein
MRILFRSLVQRRMVASIFAGLALGCAMGCHSHYVEADVKNGSDSAVSPFEVDYPSASFGKERLAPRAVFHYRFKIQGDGPTKIVWTDAKQHDHTVAGPQLQEGQEGTLRVTITGPAATWQTHLKP